MDHYNLLSLIQETRALLDRQRDVLIRTDSAQTPAGGR